MMKRIPWWAVRIAWSAGWTGFAFIYLLRDIHTHAGTGMIVFQAVILSLWTWIAYCDVHHWNRKGTNRYSLPVKRRNKGD